MNSSRRSAFAATFSIVLLTAALLPAAEPLPRTIDFDRHIQPLLSDTCYQCHGPDDQQRKADLRLDEREALFADQIVVPGKPDQSELIQRITSNDPDLRMPPPDSTKQLTERDIALLSRWVEQGAKWQGHWAYTAPVKPQPPQLEPADWIHNPIDAFVLDRLQREGLQPSPAADKTTLLRRVTLDLTGLPPTPAEVDAFLADQSPQAYEKAVDRLLDSPRYGERMAVLWLDAARYADTNGYQSDGERHMWRWRDWVIQAFNNNMPFDQFTVEQLAGDLLPQPTLEQRIATAFNRNHRGNGEGGIIADEYLVEYVVDRVETTSTVWLGLTLGCARCHNHKFDPFTQKDFYRLFAYFHNVPERGKAVKYGNSPPIIQAPTPKQREQLTRLDHKLDQARQQFAKWQPELESSLSQWQRVANLEQPIDWTIKQGLQARIEFTGDQQPAIQIQDGEAIYAAGPSGQAIQLDGQRYVEAGDVGNFGFYDQFTLSAWVYPEAADGAVLSRMTGTVPLDFTGYNLHLAGGHLQVNLVRRWLDDCIRVETEQPLKLAAWQHVAVTYDGSRWASGIHVYVDGVEQPLKIHVDELNQSFESDAPLRIGSRSTVDRLQARIDDVRVYDRDLTPDEVTLIAVPQRIEEILLLPAAERSPAQQHKLAAYYLAEQAPQPIRQAHRQLTTLQAKREKMIAAFPTCMVMEEMQTPRETHILLRGEYDKPGEPVTAGVPAVLPSLPDGVPNNRLGLARWLVDPQNPLTARVTVNRYWQTFFGTGLVKTSEDFGRQGERPSHPELLDWLAVQFMESGWDVKAMQRLIVTSATYRQASSVTPQLLERDPENRLLARGPRYRLPAEMIRDQALFAAGLLVEQQGGPSVFPYQPAGLWEEVSGDAYQPDQGNKLYRRSMYTFFKRTVAPPALMTFDTAGREACSVRRSRTNTPLQALALLNDTTFVEAARNLAQRAILEGGEQPQSRIEHAFRLMLARPPQAKELQILTSGLQTYLARYQKDPQAAKNLIAVGASTPDESIEPSELAAYTAACSLLLNLDETITKE